ncbi:MAG: hydroxymethylglutaryl-CoA reductase [Nanoarchaeota archaeon]|nr:hydroxymethylglutaryl-CoA reductase [Nanoarchaeota archaeon]
MTDKIISLEEYPTFLSTYVMGPLRLTAESRTKHPKIQEKLADDELIPLPLSTYETGLYIGVNRGAKFSRISPSGVKAYVTHDFMTRAPVLEAKDVQQAMEISDYIENNIGQLQEIAESTTHHGKVREIKSYRVGNDVYVRLLMQCGESSGHNMTTKAGTALVKYLVEQFEGVRYGSDSGNMCADKKAAAINAITGRGKTVITEIIIPKESCEKYLKTTPKELERLNTKKNLQGSIAAGSQFSANAHFANIIGAMYVATGQDIANIVEGSYGITQVKVTETGDLYFTTTHPCLIVGTVGHGKNGESQLKSLEKLGCLQKDKPNGFNSQRLAAIIAAATAMGELSLLADQTKNGRLIAAHERFER